MYQNTPCHFRQTVKHFHINDAKRSKEVYEDLSEDQEQSPKAKEEIYRGYITTLIG